MNLPCSTEVSNLEEMKRLKSLCAENYFEYVENKFVNLYFFYVLQGQCEQYKKITVELKPQGILSRDTLTDEIVKNRTEGGRRYHVNGIYSFRFDEKDLVKFAESPSHYFHNHTQVEPIQFAKSPELFQHHNSVFIWLGCEQQRKTKRFNEKSEKHASEKRATAKHYD
jgi:hypothetical protein